MFKELASYFGTCIALAVFLLCDVVPMRNCAAEDLTGILTTMTEDHRDGVTATESTILEESDGASWLLRGGDRDVLSRATGRLVSVHGSVVVPGVLQVEGIDNVAPETASFMTPTESRLAMLIGVFDIRTNLAGSTTEAELREVLNGDPTRSVKKLLEANSYGIVSIASLDVATRSVLDIPLPNPAPGASCFPWYSGTFLPAARAVFAAQGFDHTTYDRVLFIVPEVVGTQCNFAGLAISTRDTLYSGGIGPSLVLHELGHNQWPASGHGFSHASDDPNNDGVRNSEYGDDYDAMGISGYFYNLLHAEKGVWFEQAGGRTRTIAANGVYEVNLPSVEFHPRDAADEQRLQVSVPGDPRPYIITFRKMVGTFDAAYFDAFVDDRLNIHRMPVATSFNTLVVGAMIEGNSLQLSSVTVPEATLLVEFLSQQSNVARVRVTVGTADSDGDGIPNSVETDDDNDGVPDLTDCSPTIPTRWTLRAYLDQDDDGIVTSNTLVDAHVCVGSAPGTGYTLTLSPVTDNCSRVANPDQLDTDRDGVGDVCDSSPGTGAPPGGSTPTPTPTSAATPSITPIANPTTTPLPGNPGGSIAPTLSILSSRYSSTKRVLTVVFAGTGSASVPTLACNHKPPRKSTFGPRDYARSGPSSGLQRGAVCKVPLQKGLNVVRVRACEQGVCSSAEVSQRRIR